MPKACDLTAAVQLGYGPFEAYGFHALEGLQCMVERREGGETGVKAVQCLRGDEMWKAMDAGRAAMDEVRKEVVKRHQIVTLTSDELAQELQTDHTE